MITDFEEPTGHVEDETLFDCEFCSIDDVINKVIIYTGVTERQTENGLRTLIACEDGQGWRSAFWRPTASSMPPPSSSGAPPAASPS